MISQLKLRKGNGDLAGASGASRSARLASLYHRLNNIAATGSAQNPINPGHWRMTHIAESGHAEVAVIGEAGAVDVLPRSLAT